MVSRSNKSTNISFFCVLIDSTDVAMGLLAAWEGRVFPGCRSNGLSKVTLHGWLDMYDFRTSVEVP
jgi:hypothetical protein